MIKKLILVVTLIYSQVAQADSGLLDRVLTPGAINPNVTQSNLKQTVCVAGYSAIIRPSTNYTNKLKLKQLKQAKYIDKDSRHYEFDHQVPISIGGHPTDERNLWAEPRFGLFNASDKDIVESGVHRDLCKGKTTLSQAQDVFLGDWRSRLKYYKR